MMKGEQVPAWKADIYWLSTFTRVGWFKSGKDDQDGKIFKTAESAKRWAARNTGVPSFLVPYMHRRVEVVLTTRPATFMDRLRARLNMRPIWYPHAAQTPAGKS
ncbi:hypothetical protein FPZ24_08290 [Sphingomonas panacisoli]|uniref:Uncharacterized protein n=1 Tax=Sphingomonas panacisoli TaxID=1813879 RepID=A0A5B8LIQ1_9SPHN|nr:hypothetical protein [Sphingomonas panacisoli]QDZ07482.1 hypothetical protein FPZ24_08290 [Sphingomonas panacisoli]